MGGMCSMKRLGLGVGGGDSRGRLAPLRHKSDLECGTEEWRGLCALLGGHVGAGLHEGTLGHLQLPCGAIAVQVVELKRARRGWTRERG